MIGGWRWTAHARRRHYFQGDPGTTVSSFCGEHTSRLNGMEQQLSGPDDCQTCTRKYIAAVEQARATKGDRTLLP